MPRSGFRQRLRRGVRLRTHNRPRPDDGSRRRDPGSGSALPGPPADQQPTGLYVSTKRMLQDHVSTPGPRSIGNSNGLFHRRVEEMPFPPPRIGNAHGLLEMHTAFSTARVASAGHREPTSSRARPVGTAGHGQDGGLVTGILHGWGCLGGADSTRCAAEGRATPTSSNLICCALANACRP